MIKEVMDIRKISISTVLVLTIFLLADFCLAQRPMEVPLPGLEPSSLPMLPDYIGWFFNFAIGIAGFVAFISIVFGGVRYLISAGNPSAIADANDQMFSGLIGLGLIMGSWILLTTINPQLIILRAEREVTATPEKQSGVYLCEAGQAMEDCQVFTQSTPDLGSLKKRIASIKFEKLTQCKKSCDPEDCDEPECREVIGEYIAVLHDDSNYTGRCTVCLNTGCDPPYELSRASSVHIFMKADFSPGEGVSLYEGTNYNQDCPTCARWPESGGYKSANLTSVEAVGRSVKVDQPGRWMAAVFSQATEPYHYCEVFTESWPSLSGHPIEVCGGRSNLGCFGAIKVLPIK